MNDLAPEPLMPTDIQSPGPAPRLCVEDRLKNLEDTVAMLKRDLHAVASLRRVRKRTASSSSSREPKRKRSRRKRAKRLEFVD